MRRAVKPPGLPWLGTRAAQVRFLRLLAAHVEKGHSELVECNWEMGETSHFPGVTGPLEYNLKIKYPTSVGRRVKCPK